MREGTIPQNLIGLVRYISYIGARENIELKDTWFTPSIEEDPIETPSHDPSVAQENNNITLAP